MSSIKQHRFYIRPGDIELKHDFWLHDKQLIRQWGSVLGLKSGDELVLFDGVESERLYKLAEITEREARLQLITDFERTLPVREIYLFWSLLPTDKNDLVLQKCTELGVSHFIPLHAEHTEKTDFDVEHAEKIVTEAAEQCGRSDIPNVRQPVLLQTVFDEFHGKMNLLVVERTATPNSESETQNAETTTAVGVLVGPPSGWSEHERQLFKDKNLSYLSIHDPTLRAETSCVAAVTKLTAH
jgi:16S rRNA (uracil1498-N3)-methyltransferase